MRKNFWRWLVVDVLGLLVMIVGMATASESVRRYETIARYDSAASNQRLVELRRESVVKGSIGLTILLTGFGLVVLSAWRMRRGKAVFAVSALLIAFGAYRVVNFHIRYHKIGIERRAQIASDAFLRVGETHYFGNEKVPRDFAFAFACFKKSLADPRYNSPKAQGYLAECYLYGRGCNIDFKKAREHAEQGAFFGDERSRKVLESLKTPGPRLAP